MISQLDWGIILAFFSLTLLIGLLAMRRSGKSSAEFFLSGRSMPWWLLGVSMVATTFSADTPNLVTELVRKDGVQGNWAWWIFLLTGMFTVFLYSKLWRRTEVLTDLEFYELRYSGVLAAFLRGFRAIYLGFFINVLIMATVCVAAVKLGSIMLGLSPMQTLLITSVITVGYSMIGGLRGVIITDFFQFILAMVGSVWATIYILDLPEIGGLSQMVSHPNVKNAMELIPDFSAGESFMALIAFPLLIQWWSSWYPGSEPGGGGYIAQRMLSAKNEKHAIAATLLYNIAHYALRPWPWILIALASLIIYPTLADIQAAFPDSDVVMGEDIAYPAMLTLLPKGLLGLVLASLLAAFMSTLSTHLNWGASYMVNDFYVRFIDPRASDKKQVWMGRIFTAGLMVFALIGSRFIESAKDGFDLLVQVGAGTGLIYLIRWFWWRVNAWSEISGMLISGVIAVIFAVADPEWESWVKIAIGVGITTVGWITITLFTPPTSNETLEAFFNKAQPWGSSWTNRLGFERSADTKDAMGRDVLCVILGCVTVYGVLLGTGKYIYGDTWISLISFGIAGVAAFAMIKAFWAAKH